MKIKEGDYIVVEHSDNVYILQVLNKRNPITPNSRLVNTVYKSGGLDLMSIYFDDFGYIEFIKLLYKFSKNELNMTTIELEDFVKCKFPEMFI